MTFISRRDLLKRVGMTSVAVPLFDRAFERSVEGLAQQSRPPLQHFTAEEGKLMDAIVARLIPTDQLGPGATEAHAVSYIDRALGDALKASQATYSAGLAALDRYARGSRGAPFTQLSSVDQDSVLIDVETGAATGFTGSSAAFFAMVLNHTHQGTFGDPYYGGNANFVGWDLIQYPGVRTMVSAADQQALEKKELKANHKSAYEYDAFHKAYASCVDRDCMATKLKGTDVVIIGLGAAGGVAALPLAQAGLEVIGLEAGAWMTRKDFAPDEIRNNVRGWPHGVQKANQEIPTSRANASAPTGPRGTIHPMQNGVGGTTLHYWAQSWRLNPWDFKVVSGTTQRYGANRLPAGTTVEDWPFGYEELEPYYDKVEYEVGISGQAGNVNGTIDPRGNIFEAPRKRGYPMPPLRSTAFIDKMTAAAKSLGWHPFPGPAAINSRPYQNRSACMYHGFCNRGGCHVDAKNSTAVTTIPKAQATGRLKVVTRAHVTKIEADDHGRVTGVTYLLDGAEYFQPARAVLLASFTYENARLLLLSKSKAFANGLSNNHEQVGRHYFSHHQGAPVTAMFPFNIDAWYGLPAQGVAVDDFADDNFDHGGVGFIGGANLWAMSDRRPIAAAGMTTFGRVPNWGSAWKAFIRENADRSHSSYIQKTTLPYEDNYLDLDPVVKDPLGFPVCRVTAEFKDNERKIATYSQDKMEEWYRAAGAVAVQRAPVGGAMGISTHAYGGTRMGDSPERNVVDRWGFSHEVPNLGILGASVMGTSGARNPTLTVQALAWRTAERLAKNWKTTTEV